MNAKDSNAEIFDVFLCHNSEDKPAVREISQKLVREDIKPWLDEEQIRPGTSWQTALGQQIERIKSAAVFVGESGFGPWQNQEIQAFLSQFVKRNCPVIPAVLPSAKKTPELPWTLASLHWVDFRVTTPDPLEQLIWGITGKKPSEQLPSFPSSGLTAEPKNVNEELQKSGAVNDVFISCKNLDEHGVQTRDAEIAAEVYAFLTGKGLTVFLSTFTLEQLGASDYTSAIDSALESASVLLAIGTSADHLNSNWVRYEWDSFSNAIRSGSKPNGRVFSYIEGMPIRALPWALRQTQTFVHSEASLQRLYNFINKVPVIQAMSAKTRVEVYQVLSKFNSAQLDYVTERLGLRKEYLNLTLPTTALRAADILQLVGQHGSDGLQKLIEIIQEVNPTFVDERR